MARTHAYSPGQFHPVWAAAATPVRYFKISFVLRLTTLRASCGRGKPRGFLLPDWNDALPDGWQICPTGKRSKLGWPEVLRVRFASAYSSPVRIGWADVPNTHA